MKFFFVLGISLILMGCSNGNKPSQKDIRNAVKNSGLLAADLSRLICFDLRLNNNKIKRICAIEYLEKYETLSQSNRKSWQYFNNLSNEERYLYELKNKEDLKKLLEDISKDIKKEGDCVRVSNNGRVIDPNHYNGDIDDLFYQCNISIHNLFTQNERVSNESNRVAKLVRLKKNDSGYFITGMSDPKK